MALRMQEELGDDVTILFVESQGATPEQAEKFVYSHKWANDHSIWTSEQPFSNGMQGLPNATLLGNDGQVLWSGRPTSDHKKIVELINDQLKLARKGAKGISPLCAKANAEFEKGDYAAALKTLQGAPAAEKAEADKLAHSLETRARAKLARLDWYVQQGDFEKADKLLAQLTKGMAGNARFEQDVKTVATTLSSKEIAAQREASKAFVRLERMVEEGGLDAVAVKKLKALSAKYPSSTAAKRADHLVALSQAKDA